MYLLWFVTDVAFPEAPLMTSKWAIWTQMELLLRLMAGDDLCLAIHLSPGKLSNCFDWTAQQGARYLIPSHLQRLKAIMLSEQEECSQTQKAAQVWVFLIGVCACNPACVQSCKRAAITVNQTLNGKVRQHNVASRVKTGDCVVLLWQP